jgi:hypothetical protein
VIPDHIGNLANRFQAGMGGSGKPFFQEASGPAFKLKILPAAPTLFVGLNLLDF